MGLNRMGPPEALVLALQKKLILTDFIETGTYQGGTAAWAARHFKRVVTIELSPVFHAAASTRFRSQSNVSLLCGNSTEVLGKVVATLTRPALFWLDAHWSGLDTAGQEAECPVLREIEMINASPIEHVILVDDARLFCIPPPLPHCAAHWPDLATLVGVLRNEGRSHVFLTEDVFVSVPSEMKGFLTDWFQDEAEKSLRRNKVVRWWKNFSG